MQSQQHTTFQSAQPNHFRHLFPELPPLATSDEQLKKLALKMAPDEPKDPSRVITHGLSIFSQFLAHDITFESTSHLQGVNRLSALQNDRTINLDLDCVYGQRTQDFFYDSSDRNKEKLLLGALLENEGRSWYDLQRNKQGKAIIPDARNDENIIVSRLQVLFIQFHNLMVDYLKERRFQGDVFQEARKLTTWHYHWLILHEFLYKIMDWKVFDDIMTNGARYFTRPFRLPLEFTGAAFRIGHSQVRGLNRINDSTEKSLFELGSFRARKDFVDWRYLFDFGDGRAQAAMRIDTDIDLALHNIPFIDSEDRFEKSLPFRNLKRGAVYGLPSGEDVAYRMGFEPIEVVEKKELKLSGTPLWFYILREAQLLGHEGEHLGPVGSTILGECFITILKEDDRSFLKLRPKWRPNLIGDFGSFSFLDLIEFVEQQAWAF